MQMKSKIAFALLVSVCVMLFAGCNNEPKTLYQSESVEVKRASMGSAIYNELTGTGGGGSGGSGGKGESAHFFQV